MIQSASVTFLLLRLLLANWIIISACVFFYTAICILAQHGVVSLAPASPPGPFSLFVFSSVSPYCCPPCRTQPPQGSSSSIVTWTRSALIDTWLRYRLLTGARLLPWFLVLPETEEITFNSWFCTRTKDGNAEEMEAAIWNQDYIWATVRHLMLVINVTLWSWSSN